MVMVGDVAVPTLTICSLSLMNLCTKDVKWGGAEVLELLYYLIPLDGIECRAAV